MSINKSARNLIKDVSKVLSLKFLRREVDFFIKNQPYNEEILIVNNYLKYLGIETLLIRLEHNEKYRLKEFPLPFIALLSQQKDQYSILVTDIESDKVHYERNGNAHVEEITFFESNWIGVALLIAEAKTSMLKPLDKVNISDYIKELFISSQSRLIFLLSFFILLFSLVLSTVQLEPLKTTLFLAKLVGLFISYLLISHKYEKETSFVSSFCH